jgi:hypothetical protein
MNPIWSSIPAFAVAVIFYVYRAYAHVEMRRAKMLRERVAYLLWVMADKVKGNSRVVSVN